ncbi:Fungal specific transcription factor domain family protein [Aspergillus niger]|uniref:Fungal specific transcription factor domain family protein n=1 Tax=Aspergillus niger TaxID=5061 RepID=A0A505I7M3_ASPNG|nr:Fungal specific transcription factor domain family protein [Aspergillus niger]
MSNPSLYGQPRTKKSTQSEAPSASTLAFTSTLSSLIAKDSTDSSSTRGTGRPRPSKAPKSDIFSRPNKGAQKRAAADLRDDDNAALQQAHQRTQDIGAVDAATLHRSKRRMEEKVRMYEDMSRGLYLAGGESDEGEDDVGPGDAYLARLRRKEREGWRPARPDNLIYGATVQAEAFNPDAAVASRMSDLAARRDRSATPPEEMHYDADAEVRNRGTGFYAFSKDENVRRQQMEELLNAREETQRERDARRERRAERERLRDERRKKVDELRAKRRAEMFLAGLGDAGLLAGGSG